MLILLPALRQLLSDLNKNLSGGSIPPKQILLVVPKTLQDFELQS
jgi:hypothetical protein